MFNSGLRRSSAHVSSCAVICSGCPKRVSVSRSSRVIVFLAPTEVVIDVPRIMTLKASHSISGDEAVCVFSSNYVDISVAVVSLKTTSSSKLGCKCHVGIEVGTWPHVSVSVRGLWSTSMWCLRSLYALRQDTQTGPA